MSQCQKFLKLHANQMLVTVDGFKSPMDIRILQAYLGDDDLKIKHSEYVHSREFLFMPVHKSPLLVALMQKPWHYRYTDSFSSISLLWSMISSITTLLKIPRDDLVAKLDEMDEKMFERLKVIKNGEEDFKSVMGDFTIEKIQTYERFLWKILNLKMPVEFILTPHMFPKIENLMQDDQKVYFQRMAHCFETKEVLRNVRLEKASPEGEYVFKKYFPNKGQNLQEYFNFLNE